MHQGRGFDGIQLIEDAIPRVHDYGVLVKIHAAAVNPRELFDTEGVLAVSY